MSREIVSIATGQGGVQLGHAAWELYLGEHGVNEIGKANDDLTALCGDDAERSINTFFNQTRNNHYVPRSVIFDLEPSAIDEIRVGNYRNLYHPECLINGYEDGANNFARGYLGIGKSFLAPVLSKIRKRVEDCDSMQGFLITCGIGGGTGSGFTDALLKVLSDEFTRKNKFMFNIFPGPSLSNIIIEPYNVSLATGNHIDECDLNILLDNQALYDAFVNVLEVPSPYYHDINRLLAQVSSSITSCMRFQTDLNSDLDQLMTNVVPYPALHFPVVSYAPIMSVCDGYKSACSPSLMMQEVFTRQCRLNSCDTSVGKYMSCNLIFRGRISPSVLYNIVGMMKKSGKLNFVDWCPTGFKAGICTQCPVATQKQLFAQSSYNITLISNHTSISQLYENVLNKFNYLFQKRAFIHWFVGEGMEEGELNEAYEKITTMIGDYKEIIAEGETEESVVNEEGDLDNAKTESPPVKNRESSTKESEMEKESENPEGNEPNEPNEDVHTENNEEKDNEEII